MQGNLRLSGEPSTSSGKDDRIPANALAPAGCMTRACSRKDRGRHLDWRYGSKPASWIAPCAAAGLSGSSTCAVHDKGRPARSGLQRARPRRHPDRHPHLLCRQGPRSFCRAAPSKRCRQIGDSPAPGQSPDSALVALPVKLCQFIGKMIGPDVGIAVQGLRVPVTGHGHDGGIRPACLEER